MRANLARPAGQDLLMKQGYLLTYCLRRNSQDVINRQGTHRTEPTILQEKNSLTILSSVALLSQSPLLPQSYQLIFRFMYFSPSQLFIGEG